jgi:hypothetical protein
MRTQHPSAYVLVYGDESPIIAHTRTRYTHLQKGRVVEKYYELLRDPKCKRPYIEATKWAFGSTWTKKKGHLNKWLTACGSVRKRVQSGRKARKGRRSGATKPSDHPDCEDELYIRFLFRRTALG